MAGLVAAHWSAVIAVAAATPPPFALELIPEPLAEATGARCLDHSPAGYYIRRQDPKRWVVFLQGGGLCVEPVDCIARRFTDQGSSRHWRTNATPPDNHMLTETSALNPFADWSHVFVPYCSGDMWLGNSSEGHTILGGLQMSGHLILETIVDRLANLTDFSTASDVILSGTSAGAVGTFHHVDWFAEKVGRLALAKGARPPRVTGMPVEGVFFPQGFPVLFPQFVFGGRSPVDRFFARYLTGLFGPAWLHTGCVAAAEEHGFGYETCFDISVMFKYIASPMFVMMNQFDKLMIQDLGTCFSCTASASPSSLSGKFIRFFGDLMQHTLASFRQVAPRTGLFVTSEFHHDENFGHFFMTRAKYISGVSLRSAVERWYFHGELVDLIEQACGAAHDMPCHEEEHVVLSLEAPAALLF